MKMSFTRLPLAQENNPLVFTQLSQALGVQPTLGFYDVYSIDDPDLLSFIPRPVYALLFTCQQAVFFRARDADYEAMEEYKGSGDSEPAMWFRQTIGHTCGLMALLHGLSNGEAKQYIKPGSLLAKLLKEAIPLQPTERAKVLYDSQELEDVHMAAATIGDTEAPRSEEPSGNHYICFAKGSDGHLWELNGGMKGPVDRGALAENEDMLSEKALQLGVRSFLKHAREEEMDFSMVAMAPSLD
ncbi:uncharacterized protein KY384_000838 [Bacidia gigantensis]|uniref:uncharacterized protein n=1 Tax=Bacidia gigantensis TaxID=2732470 RepID=UPI001D03978A|nr:uncharacterized protein KY384_000838 [Bacidia gigantensis]KAG8533996.1 hypothetical protein KY384_000838 [Bacidia gigantensis]